jgi:hypothetical protein
MLPYEPANIRAYQLLIRIEVALREAVRQAFEGSLGPNWRKRLPGDMLKRIREAERLENRPQFGFQQLGPLHYLTFGDLVGLLTGTPGKNAATVFGGASFVHLLEGLIPSRNAISHARPVDEIGLQLVEVVYSQMVNTLGLDGFTKLANEADMGVSVDVATSAIRKAIADAIVMLPQLPRQIPVPAAFEKARAQYWWAEDDLAGFDRGHVEHAVSLLYEYNSLPDGVGSAGRRVEFCEERELISALERADQSLRGSSK